MKKRSEADSKYTWKLEDMVAEDSQWEQMFKEASGEISEYASYKGRLAGSADTLYACHAAFYNPGNMVLCVAGNVDPEKEKLVRVTNEAVEKGLEQVKPWGFLGDMGQAVHDYAKQNGYTVVEEVGGHGVGLEFHEDPFVSYVTRRGEEMLMAPGMIFTIEPMINMGRPDIFVDDSNGWTIYTDDRLPSAQREIMVLVTETGHEVLAW